MNRLIGIDLGGTRIKCGLFDTEGRLLEQQTLETRDGEVIDRKPAWMVAIREQLIAWSPDKQCPVGVSAPGLAAGDRRCIAYMPGRLHQLEGFDWTTEMRWRNPIPVVNDAHAALLGEVWCGAAKGEKEVAMLTLGTGVGGAALVGGRLLRGHLGRAGHLGHICLDPLGAPDIVNTPGSLEEAIGDATLPERSNGRFTGNCELMEALKAQDPEAQRVWRQSIRALACGMASLINVLDPRVFLLGGGQSKAGEALLEPLHEALNEVEWRPGGHQVEVRIATLSELAGCYGAAYQLLKKE